MTVMVTSHDMADLEQLAGRIVMIDRGRIAFDGDFDRLRREFADRRRLLLETADGAAPALARRGAGQQRSRPPRVRLRRRPGPDRRPAGPGRRADRRSSTSKPTAPPSTTSSPTSTSAGSKSRQAREVVRSPYIRLSKSFCVEQVLTGRDVQPEPRRARRVGGAQRRRQDHADQDYRGGGDARRRQRTVCAARPAHWLPAARAGVCAPRRRWSRYIARPSGDTLALTSALGELASRARGLAGRSRLAAGLRRGLHAVCPQRPSARGARRNRDGAGSGPPAARNADRHFERRAKTRLALAGVLLSDPQLLLLDEPTNHLDSRCSTWLEAWLRGYRGAALVRVARPHVSRP